MRNKLEKHLNGKISQNKPASNWMILIQLWQLLNCFEFLLMN